MRRLPGPHFRIYFPFAIIKLEKRELLCLSIVQISPTLDLKVDEQRATKLSPCELSWSTKP